MTTAAPISVSIVPATLTLLRETFEGPSGPSTYYIDNDPSAGFLATLGGLSAADASKPFGKAGASIAGHAHHAAFHLEMSGAWLRGDRAPRDWNRSWSVTAVDEPAWAALRESLRDRFEQLARAIEEQAPADDESLATTIAAIAHAAYHLGAIRQRLAMA
jgi:DinB family protein